MIEIINFIFNKSGFSMTASRENWLFFENSQDDQQSYILVHLTPIAIVRGYIESVDFELGLTFFQEQKKLKADIEKNTSLVILSKADDLESDFREYKNSILEVEEDEFWFKKYVLVYNDISVVNIDKTQDVLDQFTTCVLTTSRFTTFKEGMFEDPEYFVSMQIFLKLPFLNVPLALREEYFSIETILQNNLSYAQLNYMALIERQMESMTDAEWDQLKADSVSISDAQKLESFFTKFKDDDQNS